MPLIVFEGMNVNALHLREPGGTALGERQRDLLLDPATQACPTAELFGYLQARAQLCHEIIAPALKAGSLVILDRFYHSTLAYQAYGLGLDITSVRAAITLAIGAVKPDVVLWLKVDPSEASRRRAAARGQDRIEARGLAYQQKVHDGYQALVASDGLIAIDASVDVDRIEQTIWQHIQPFMT